MSGRIRTGLIRTDFKVLSEETTQKIQDSLDEYNNIIKDLAIEQQNLIKTKKETKDIKDYEIHLKNEIILFKRNLEILFLFL